MFNTTKIYTQSVKHGDVDLHDYLLTTNNVPLLLNFTYRGDPKCNKLTKPLYKLLNFKIAKKVNLVDVECDEPENRDLLVTYGVRLIPSVVAVRSQLIADVYLPDVETLDERQLEEWINSIAVD